MNVAKIPGKITTRIVEYLRIHPKSTAYMIRSEVGGTAQQIVQTLYRLCSAGHIESKRMRPKPGTVDARATDEVLHYWV